MSKAQVDTSKKTNYSILPGVFKLPNGKEELTVAIDFDVYNKETGEFDNEIDEARSRFTGDNLDGSFDSGTCGNSVILVKIYDQEIIDLIKPHKKLKYTNHIGAVSYTHLTLPTNREV